MAASHRQVFEKFVETVKKNLGDSVEQILLFGSVARGEETRQSDIDVLLVVSDKTVKEKIFDIAYDLMLQHDVYLSPKVIGEKEYQRMKEKETSFLKRIQPEATVYG